MTDGSKQITENPTASEIPTTAGMTTKVVKGSLWTLAGQVAPLAVSLLTTPFTIRLLGAENYGVLILIGLIPTYLGFADFGMGMASTKFGSEAYAEGDKEKEARIVRTAALIALCSSVPVAAALIIFAEPVIGLFNVPTALQTEAALALRIAAVTFVVNFLCGIFNTPQLARLRMDLNTFINAGTRIAGLIATPIVIYLGYGIVGAVTVLLIASLLQLAGHVAISRQLLPALSGLTIDPKTMRPLASYGGPLVISSIAALVLTNSEKGILSAIVSTAALAHYSVAFTLANMVLMIASSLTQSLFPAFSQLQSESNTERLNELYSRGIRISLILLFPSIFTFALLAKPFLTIWAGEDFGYASFKPFMILLVGVAFNLIAIYPNISLFAAGRTSILAKLYWFEVVPYLIIVWQLTTHFGAVGAAIAWSIRITADFIIQFCFAKRFTNVRATIPGGRYYLLTLLLFISPIAVLIVFNNLSLAVSILIITLIIYAAFFPRYLLKDEEKMFLSNRLGFIGRMIFD